MAVQRRPKQGKPASGRVQYVVRYRDPTGKERSETFDRKKDADDRDAEIRRSINRGTWTDPALAKLTVAEVFAMWVAAKPRRPGTVDLYNNTLNRQLGWLGEYPIGKVTAVDVASWHEDLRTCRRWLDKDDTGLSAGTARDQVRRLRSAFVWAIEQDIISRSPVTVPAGENREIVRREEIPTAAEAMRVINLLRDGGTKYQDVKRKGEPPREYTMQPQPVAADMLAVAMLTGMRINEICGLIPEDIDLDRGLVYVTMQMCVRSRRRVPVKSKASERKIPIAPQLDVILRRYVHGKAPTDWVFCGGSGRSLRSSRLAVYVDRAAAHAGCERVHFHAMRHFFASSLIGAGRPIPEVADVMGHAKPSTTSDIYTHIIDRDASGMRDAIASSIGCGIDAGYGPLRAVP